MSAGMFWSGRHLHTSQTFCYNTGFPAGRRPLARGMDLIGSARMPGLHSGHLPDQFRVGTEFWREWKTRCD